MSDDELILRAEEYQWLWLILEDLDSVLWKIKNHHDGIEDLAALEE
jgi:hypothetical protein